jgi:hypothetical protein
MDVRTDQELRVVRMRVTMREIERRRTLTAIRSQLVAIENLLAWSDAAYGKGIPAREFGVSPHSDWVERRHSHVVDQFEVEYLSLSSPLVAYISQVIPLAAGLGSAGAIVGLVNLLKRIDDLRLHHAETDAKVEEARLQKERYSLMRRELRIGIQKEHGVPAAMASSHGRTGMQGLSDSLDDLTRRAARAAGEVEAAELIPQE